SSCIFRKIHCSISFIVGIVVVKWLTGASSFLVCCAQTSLYQGRSSFSISAFSNSYTHRDFTLSTYAAKAKQGRYQNVISGGSWQAFFSQPAIFQEIAEIRRNSSHDEMLASDVSFLD
ncbi:hypothetical protein P9H28_18515, partial [Paenibacillus barengoltzii]|uniref:hypothetical protein n=1 Tax=Paenibacillus barengoltzii TaxID=343517 RepID=UPI002DBCC198